MSKFMKKYSEQFYHGFRIRENYEPYIWNEDLLDAIECNFKAAKRIHKTRTLTGRFEFTFPKHHIGTCEFLFSAFIAEFVKHFPPEFQLFYMWVREQEESNHPHYHLQLWVSKESKQSLHRLYIYASVLWCKHLNIPVMKGYVHRDPEYTIRWKQGYSPDNQQLSKAFRHAAYIAKTKEKSLTAKNAMLYGCSNISRELES